MDKQERITFLSGISNAALAAGELPTELLLLAWGDNPTGATPPVARVNERTLAAIREQVAGGVFDRVVVDFEHASSKAHPNYQPPPRKHAAYGRPEVREGQGLFLAAIEWTPAGREFAREYADLSPSIYHQPDGTVTRLFAVALCPNGAVKGLSFFAADAAQSNPTETRMDELKALIQALDARIVALEAKIKDAETAQADMSAQLTRHSRQAILRDASRDGKVVNLDASAIEKLTPSELQAHVDKIAVTVPLGRQTANREAASAAGETLLAQYNALSKPAERAAFFQAHRKDFVG